MGWIQDKPGRFQLICVLVIIVVLGAIELRWPVFQADWVSPTNRQTRLDIYLGTLGAAAIVSGFSGVVSVFGLTSDSERFITFRVRAGKALQNNWSNVVAAGLLSMGFALAAALTDTVFEPRLATILFALACWFLLENAVRTVWLMKKLINVTADSDQQKYAEDHF